MIWGPEQSMTPHHKAPASRIAGVSGAPSGSGTGKEGVPRFFLDLVSPGTRPLPSPCASPRNLNWSPNFTTHCLWDLGEIISPLQAPVSYLGFITPTSQGDSKASTR